MSCRESRGIPGRRILMNGIGFESELSPHTSTHTAAICDVSKTAGLFPGSRHAFPQVRILEQFYMFSDTLTLWIFTVFCGKSWLVNIL